MNDPGQRVRIRSSDTRAARTEDGAFEYWIAKAAWLSRAKLRVRTDHFRRDAPASGRDRLQAR